LRAVQCGHSPVVKWFHAKHEACEKLCEKSLWGRKEPS
ncbi:jg25459, partial [Pararge aegeria aegeria]